MLAKISRNEKFIALYFCRVAMELGTFDLLTSTSDTKLTTADYCRVRAGRRARITGGLMQHDASHERDDKSCYEY